MSEPPIPDDIDALAEERSRARAVRDWATADELKARIEAAGWRVVDSGTDYVLSPARPADVVEDGRTYHGAVESVPSRLDEPESAPVTLAVIVTSGGPAPAPTLEGLAADRPPGVQVMVVAHRDVHVDGPVDEVVATAVPFSAGDALQAALRRSTGTIIVVIEAGLAPSGDIATMLAAALEDDTVAIAGLDGLVSADMRHYGPGGPGDVTVLGPGCYAFRRRDAISRGPVDGRLVLPSSVAAWWSLVLRDEGPDAEPRRALAMELPLERSNAALSEVLALPDDHARLARRDAYRIAERFAHHRGLALATEEVGRVPGDGADCHGHDDDTDEDGQPAEP